MGHGNIPLDNSFLEEYVIPLDLPVDEIGFCPFKATLF